MFRLTAIASLIACLPVSLVAADAPWGMFRGPNGSGVLEGGTLPTELSLETNLAWRIDLEPGYSSPVVDDDSVYVTAHDGLKLHAICFDRATGEERWRADAPEHLEKRLGTINSPVSSTPVTDGTHIYVLFPNFGLVCYDKEGTEVWQHKMDHFNVPHHMSSSPVLAGNAVVLQCDQDTDSYIVAVDRTSGSELWKVDRPGAVHGYSTPAVYETEDGRAEVIVSGSLQLSAYDAATGEKKWWVDGMAWQTKAIPQIVGDHVYVHAYMGKITEFGAPNLRGTFADGLEQYDGDGDGAISRGELDHPLMGQLWFLYDLNQDKALDEREWEVALSRGKSVGGLFDIKLGGEGDVTSTHVGWSFDDKRSMPDCPSPVIWDGVLYLIKEGGLLSSIDLDSGTLIKRGRAAESDQYFASPVCAGGRLLLASKGGQLSVVEPGDGEWEVLSVLDLEETIWATPALSDGQVFVRTQDALYSFKTM